MIVRLTTFLCLIALFPLGSLAQSTDNFSQQTNPATQEDLAGVWEMYYQHYKKSEADTTNPFYARYQVFQFREDGVLKNVTATKRVDEYDRKLLLRIMPDNVKWEMPRDGSLVLRRTELDADGVDIHRVTESFQDPLIIGSPKLKTGDLVLIYFDQERKPYMRRYLRLIPEEVKTDSSQRPRNARPISEKPPAAN